MNCIVTAGPTFEPLDGARRLTNFSTGRLGTEMGNHLVGRGHHVKLLLGEQTTWRGNSEAQEVVTFTTTADLAGRLQSSTKERVDAVFHAAAVSDFAFGKVWRRLPDGQLEPVQARKISTRQGELLAELVPTQKIIAQLRGWFPSACLVGWKYELDGQRADVIAEAERQIADYHTNACVANGSGYGTGFGLVTAPGRCVHLGDASSLFTALENLALR